MRTLQPSFRLFFLFIFTAVSLVTFKSATHADDFRRGDRRAIEDHNFDERRRIEEERLERERTYHPAPVYAPAPVIIAPPPPPSPGISLVIPISIH